MKPIEGPYEVFQKWDDGVYMPEIVSPEMRRIAELTPLDGEDNATRTATARLLAASWDLLKACEGEVAGSKCICDILRRVSTSDLNDTVCNFCKTTAAIAKAKGETP